jgi:hypothetical protein
MTSEKQIEANRKNAKHSIGPKTPEGKNIVRFNTLKHGLRAKKALLLPGEDANELDNLAKRIKANLQPVGEMENLLVELIISDIWRLRRIFFIESGLLNWAFYGLQEAKALKEARSYELVYPDIYLPQLKTEPMDEYKHSAALERAREAEELQKSDVPMLGMSFAKSQDSFSVLMRYQTTLERSLHQYMDKLWELQDRRRALSRSSLGDDCDE